MPSKSRRHRVKRFAQAKKKKGTLARAAQQQPISPPPEPVSRPDVSAPSAGVPTPVATVPTSVATVTAARSPYITTELRRIGILAGVILVILVVLAVILA